MLSILCVMWIVVNDYTLVHAQGFVRLCVHVAVNVYDLYRDLKWASTL